MTTLATQPVLSRQELVDMIRRLANELRIEKLRTHSLRLQLQQQKTIRRLNDHKL